MRYFLLNQKAAGNEHFRQNSVLPCQGFFVDGIVIERIIVGTARHANQCIVIFQCFCVAENERIVSWCNDDLITIGKIHSLKYVRNKNLLFYKLLRYTYSIPPISYILMCEKFRASHFLKQIRFCENLRSLLFSYGKVLLTGHCDPDSGSLPFAAGRTESENDGCRVSGTVRTDRSAVGCELFLKKCRKSVLRASNFCGCTLQEGCVVFSNTRKKCSFFPVKLSDSKKRISQLLAATASTIIGSRHRHRFLQKICPSFIFPRMLLFPQKSMFSTFTLPDKTMPISETVEPVENIISFFCKKPSADSRKSSFVPVPDRKGSETEAVLKSS